MKNELTIRGHLTRDPELKQTTTGKSVCKFAIANNNPLQPNAAPTYIDVIVWEKAGESCATHLKKGSHVLVTGRLVVRSYTDKDGATRKAVEVVAQPMGVEFIGSKPAQNGEAAAAQAIESAQAPAEELDEVPF